jgi:hypothetical protein
VRLLELIKTEFAVDLAYDPKQPMTLAGLAGRIDLAMASHALTHFNAGTTQGAREVLRL